MKLNKLALASCITLAFTACGSESKDNSSTPEPTQPKPTMPVPKPEPTKPKPPKPTEPPKPLPVPPTPKGLPETINIEAASTDKAKVGSPSEMIVNGKVIDDLVMTKKAYRAPYLKSFQLLDKVFPDGYEPKKGEPLYDILEIDTPEISTYRGYSKSNPNIMFYGAVFSSGILEINALYNDENGSLIPVKDKFFVRVSDGLLTNEINDPIEPIMLEVIDSKNYDIEPNKESNTVTRGNNEELGDHNYLFRMQYIDYEPERSRPEVITKDFLTDQIIKTELQAIWQSIAFGTRTGLKFDVAEYYWHSNEFTWDFESTVGDGYIDPDYSPYMLKGQSHNMQYLSYYNGGCWAAGSWSSCYLGSKPHAHTMHEIGHNFGLGHNEPSDSYSNVMDSITLGTMQSRAINTRINHGKIMPPIVAETFPTPPTAFKDFKTIFVNEQATIKPVENDFDVNMDELELTGAELISGSGSITFDNEKVVFTPEKDWQGQAVVRYTIAEPNNSYGQTGSNIIVIDIVESGLIAKYDFDSIQFDLNENGLLDETELDIAFNGDFEKRFNYVIRRYEDKTGDGNNLYPLINGWGTYLEPKRLVDDIVLNMADHTYAGTGVKGKSAKVRMVADNSVTPRWTCDSNFDNDFNNDKNACTQSQIDTLQIKPLDEPLKGQFFTVNDFNPASKNFAFSGWFQCGDNNCKKGTTLLASKMHDNVMSPNAVARNYGGWQIYLENGEIKASIASRKSTTYDNTLDLSSGVKFDTMEWKHVVMNINRDLGKFELWVDGLKTDTVDIPADFGEIIAMRPRSNGKGYVGGGTTIIGGHLGYYEKVKNKFKFHHRLFNGVDEVEIYRAALNKEDIDLLYSIK